MLCEHCQEKIGDGITRCPACGKRIHPGCWFCAGGSLLCRNCGAEGELVDVGGYLNLMPLSFARRHKHKGPSVTCQNCQGTGIDPLPCPICLGTGIPKPVKAICPICNGTGIETCRVCGGTGNCRGECKDGYECCPDCEGKGCEACGFTGKQDCIYCEGSGCSKCNHTRKHICYHCNGLGRCTECSGGRRTCIWCDPEDHTADVMEIWDRGFHRSERQGDVGEIMFFHRLVAPYLDTERKGMILKYIEKSLVPCGFPMSRMEDLRKLLS